MITNCRSCKSNKLVEIVSLGEQYIPSFSEENRLKAPLTLLLCGDCSLLQLSESVPLSDLYTDDYGYYSGVNNTMRKHLQEIVSSAMQKTELSDFETVVDIGSNDATLLKNYPDTIRCIGFDLVPKFEKYYDQVNLDFVNKPFSKEEYFKLTDKKAKIITAISMFYDLDDPETFMKDLAEVVDENGVIIIQQNYLPTMLKNNAFDNIVHEHVTYYSLTSFEKIAIRCGLEVFDVELNDLNGGSIRTYLRPMNNVRKLRLMEQKMKLGQQLTYTLFGMRINKIAKQLYTFVKKQVDNGRTVYVYGASTRGNTLLQMCGLDNKLIKAAVERNPDKWGKKISGIPIISEEQAREEKPDYMLVLPYFFKKEFIKREQAYREAGGHLIFPLPEFEVI